MSEVENIVKTSIREIADTNPSQWDGAAYEAIKLIEIDNRGDVGELIVVNMLKALGRNVLYRRGTTHDEKDWDFICDSLAYEVKTATLGKDGITFQHESIHKTRQYDGLIFVDIAPDTLYISCHCKKDIQWNDLHRRKDSTFYKWDTSIKEGRKYCVKQNQIIELSDFNKIFDEAEEKIRKSKTPDVREL